MQVPVRVLSCPLSHDGPLGHGVYSVEVYGIENDGSLSPVPAVVQTITVDGLPPGLADCILICPF